MNRVRLGVIIAVVASLVTVVLVVALHGGSSKSKNLPPGATEVSIPVQGGVSLKATLIRPGNVSAKAKVPLLVMPGSWGAGDSLYARLGVVFASKGYEIVGYGQRGFGGSGGQVDLAGEP